MTNRIKELFEASKGKPHGLVVCGFPGVGKSTVQAELKRMGAKVLDSDSSTFDKADFPANYIKHIKESIADGKTILASSHDVVRNALINEGIPFTLVYPDKKLKEEYLKRYEKRGSPEAFVKLLDTNWNKWIGECDALEDKLVTKVKLKAKEFISLDKVVTAIMTDFEGKKLSQKEIVERFERVVELCGLYQKSGVYQARKGKAGEHVVTEIDGEKETEKTVKDGEVVIKGPKGEMYVVSNEKFKDRYKVAKALTDKFQDYEAKGMIRAFEYKGPTFKFVASWDEEMLCKDGDFLATPVPDKTTFDVPEVYRIERSVFDQTYKKYDPDVEYFFEQLFRGLKVPYSKE